MPNIYIAVNVRALVRNEWNVYTQTRGGDTYDNIARIFSRQFARGAFATRRGTEGKDGNGGEERNYSRINYAT